MRRTGANNQDKLAQFSYRIFQLKFVVFECVLLLSFLRLAHAVGG